MSPPSRASVASSPSRASTWPVCPSYSPQFASVAAGSPTAPFLRAAILSLSQPAFSSAGSALPPGLRTCSSGRVVASPSAVASAGSPRRVSSSELSSAASMASSSSMPISTTREQPRSQDASSHPSGFSDIFAWKKSS
eukprot:CAMPEP_0175592344 /NCGR_PEP_ID=MMETSP0096-20121207/53343_1 /TAXON_ID=311494 /ORGANISM="Alexandrium monilatum, Strain CCMP3105" /LENGTH=137 /DNA_ID=CAMNT_0016896523 /DNA_START=109 /DNA_END=522 /DNA_ORIENTATION=+